LSREQSQHAPQRTRIGAGGRRQRLDTQRAGREVVGDAELGCDRERLGRSETEADLEQSRSGWCGGGGRLCHGTSFQAARSPAGAGPLGQQLDHYAPMRRSGRDSRPS
jgi:hypothetical protein